MEFNALLKHFFDVYGRRNRLFLPSLSDRISFLNLAIGDLQEAVKKPYKGKVLHVAVTRVGARIFCLAEYLRDIPLIETMARKFPADNCSYCHTYPCNCPELRPDYVLADKANGKQLRWSLGDWCAHLRGLYGDRNRQKRNRECHQPPVQGSMRVLESSDEAAAHEGNRSADGGKARA